MCVPTRLSYEAYGPQLIISYVAKLGVEYVDLYLIHHPRLAQPDIPTAWAEMEAIKRAGLAK